MKISKTGLEIFQKVHEIYESFIMHCGLTAVWIKLSCHNSFVYFRSVGLTNVVVYTDAGDLSLPGLFAVTRTSTVSNHWYLSILCQSCNHNDM